MFKGAYEYCDVPKDTRKRFAECVRCRQEIYHGEGYYEWQGDYYHDCCFEENAVAILKDAGAEYEIAGAY